MKEFGLQLYSIREHFTTPENTKETFLKMKEFGYSTCQTAGVYAYITPELFRQYADEAGIRIVGTHYDWNRIVNDVEGTVKYHQILGVKYIGIGGLPAYYQKNAETVKEFVSKFNEMARIYAKYGFKLDYHNHSHEFIKYDGKNLYDYLVEGFNPETTTFCLDTCWAQLAGIDVRDMIERLGSRISMLHLKDIEAAHVYELADGTKTRLPKRIEVGCGNMNFGGIIKCAEANGIHDFIVEDEVYSTGDPLESVRISAENIKAKWLEK